MGLEVMDSATIRRKFLEFFEKKGHQIVPSAPLVLKNDPALVFTNSGMVQFKDFFLGNAIPKNKRVADTQKCLRVSGKHNDLEDVGHDTYHHTMFEMLGNWSFGDYFKKEAIAWAWELLTEVYKLPKDRLYVSVFGGDKDDNLSIDQEAFDLWKSFVEVDRIILGNKKDNFWEMADVGPCGPCSEIHIDLRSEAEVKKKPGKELVNNDHPQVVEIWNLVFMEFERSWNPQKGGSNALMQFDLSASNTDKKAREKLRSELTVLKPLPAKNVDTGMGFERLCMAIQQKTSNYDTDVFTPLINFIAKEAGVTYGYTSPSPLEGGEVKKDIAIRVMAWCVGLHGFLDADATTPDRIARMARMMWTSGHRIALDLPDAISQKNNHGMSAATGLLTIGILFPEFPESRAWVARARSILERLGRELIYADGAFVQHSLNYQRLMLHDYLWALRLGQLAGVGFSDELRNLVRRSAELLWRLQDESTGSVPQYGQFDGALILPLDNCDYLDFRPVTQAVGYLMDGKKWWRDGPWDEALLWLFGPPALTAPVDAPERVDVVAPDGGYYTLRAVDTFVMTRCATFRHRPGQPDMLHVDVWWRGQNVAIDAGTFSYADDNSPWQELVRTRAHNTVSVDDADQMERFGRFLWFPWLTSTLLHRAHVGSGDDDYWEGEHDGYARRGVRHRRRIVRLPASAWVVIDLLEASQDHSYRLHWLLPDGSHEWDASTLAVLLRFREGNYAIQVATRGGTAVGDLQRASTDGAGWRSKYYYSREPAASLSVSTQAATQTFVTILAPAPASVRMDEHGIDVTVDGRLHRLDAEGGPLEAR